MSIKTSCDYIAMKIQQALSNIVLDGVVDRISRIKHDLSETGKLASPKKTIVIYGDKNKNYKVTIEEI